jgi:hypothetical protein
MKNLKDYTIDQQTAEQYVSDWQSGTYTLVPSTVTNPPSGAIPIDSFVFHFGDFQDFVDQVKSSISPAPSDLTGVICRLGMKPNPIASGTDLVPCLIFEAVENFNVPSSGDPEAGKSMGDINSVTDRYDFSYPCPPTCPQGVISPRKRE